MSKIETGTIIILSNGLRATISERRPGHPVTGSVGYNVTYDATTSSGAPGWPDASDGSVPGPRFKPGSSPGSWRLVPSGVGEDNRPQRLFAGLVAGVDFVVLTEEVSSRSWLPRIDESHERHREEENRRRWRTVDREVDARRRMLRLLKKAAG
jgi:hypothetical protein